ncbi:hypothetical protein GOY07_03330 [Wolbachia endosymbiont of Litomosoides sigmodontis]|nr:hypothetical protein [Wolbachia endosymbiont of Litomosoides sigmodontis]QKX03186.1 hypothetical protein GOY07_03330 [Wolbachia endosymbiont of Litomosoides sigmodontis]
MALKSKLLDKRVIESVKEVLKEMRNNTYVARKLSAIIAAKKYYITVLAKICFILKMVLTV